MKTYYSPTHEFITVDGNIGTVGITEYAREALGKIVYVDMPEVDDDVTVNEDFGAVESVKAASDLISPVSGKVVEINEELVDNPSLLNKGQAPTWIIKVEIDDPAQLELLLDEKAYAELCASQH